MIQNRHIAIVGATASGKTKLSLDLAEKLNREVVNADVGLFYTELNIGVAKPTAPELKKIYHHMVNFLSCKEDYSLGEYLTKTQKLLVKEEPTKVIVGGSGQYVWGLVENWQPPAVKPEPKLRQELHIIYKEKGLPSLLEILYEITDKDTIQKLDLKNPRRVMRAIEVCKANLKAISIKSTEYIKNFHIIGIYWPKDELHKRCNFRLEQMLKNGWIDEVEQLTDKYDLEQTAPCFKMIGYTDVFKYIQGQISFDECKETISNKLLKLVSSQLKWFRLNDHRIHWLPGEKLFSSKLSENIENYIF